MFYGWEDFRKESSEGSLLSGGETLETVSALKKQIEVMRENARAKDYTIAKLQRDLESATAALRAEQVKHAETMARDKELERQLQQRVKLEQALVKQMEDQDVKHDMAKERYESEIQRLLALVGTLSDAEELLCSQLGDLEAEAMEQTRYFKSEIGSLSRIIVQKEQELTSVQDDLESMRQRRISVKEMETMDLAAQLSKSTQECDKLRLRTESLHEENERLKREASNLQQELAMAKLISLWQQNENKAMQEEKRRVLRRPLCRSESLSVATQPRTRRCGA